MASRISGKVGGGRNTHVATQLRRAGKREEADAISPPTEIRLRDHPELCCGARTVKPPHNPCQNSKGGGTDHPGYGYCAQHGGNTEAVIKSAMREMGRDLIKQYKEEHHRFGGDRHDPSVNNITPEEAMLEEVRRSAAMVRFLEERIARWNLSSTQLDLVERFVQESGFPRGGMKRALPLELKKRLDAWMDSLPEEDEDSPYHLPPLVNVNARTGLSNFTQLREWLFVYREERQHLVRTAKLTIDAGVSLRLVSLAEDQGRILASALRAVLDALMLTPEQAKMVPKIVPPILRAVANNQPLPSLETLLGVPGLEQPRALPASPRATPETTPETPSASP